MENVKDKLSAKAKWIIAGIIFVIVVIILIIIYRSGKKKGEAAGAINLSSSALPDGSAPSSSDSEIKQLAQDTYNDMAGANLTHDDSIWRRVLVLSDADFIRLYNQFDTLFQKSSGQSMKQWVLSEESHSWTPFTGSWDSTQKTLLDRMSKLNLI